MAYLIFSVLSSAVAIGYAEHHLIYLEVVKTLGEILSYNEDQ